MFDCGWHILLHISPMLIFVMCFLFPFFLFLLGEWEGVLAFYSATFKAISCKLNQILEKIKNTVSANGSPTLLGIS